MSLSSAVVITYWCKDGNTTSTFHTYSMVLLLREHFGVLLILQILYMIT